MQAFRQSHANGTVLSNRGGAAAQPSFPFMGRVVNVPSQRLNNGDERRRTTANVLGMRRHRRAEVQQAPETLSPPAAPNPEPVRLLSSIDQDTFSNVGTASFAGALHNHPCLQLILQRAAAGSKPGARAPGDTAKLGLVVEGGGMRGVVSGAMLMALYGLGLRDSFDVVYGASAGAINTTYFLSGQRQGLDIYAEHLTGNEFINLRALLRGEPVMNLDFLIDYIMHHVMPLDWHAVMKSPVPLKVVASSLDSLAPVLLEGWSSRRDLVECLKATATVPQIAGQPRLWRGHRLVDAAIFEPVPLRTALGDGCSHVLVLCTRPATLHTSWHRKVVHGTVTHVVKRTVLNAPYMRPAWSSPHCSQLAAQDAELVATLAEPPAVTHTKLGGYVLPVYPHSVAGCHPATTCPNKLRRAEAEGWRAIASLFGCQHLLPQLGVPLIGEHTNQQTAQPHTSTQHAHLRASWHQPDKHIEWSRHQHQHHQPQQHQHHHQPQQPRHRQHQQLQPGEEEKESSRVPAASPAARPGWPLQAIPITLPVLSWPQQWRRW